MERLDNYYVQLAGEAGGIRELVDSFFGFLLRRTDFFYEADPGDKMGFPPGAAQRMVGEAFLRCQAEHYQRHPKKSIEEYLAKKASMEETAAVATPAPAPTLTPAPTPTPASGPNAFADISTFNGASTDKYRWSQSITEVTVQVDLPRATKAKELRVLLEPTRVEARYANEPVALLAGELFHRIKPSESSWVIDDGRRLLLLLEKADENIWKTVLRGDGEIDPTTVDNSKRLEEFDEETQGALRKVLYEQNRKERGLPTTEEEQQMEVLRKAWDSPGSPFRGTPFDPSKVNLPFKP